VVGARLDKVRQVWRRVKPYLLGFLVILVVAGAIWALIYVPKWQVPVCPPGKEGLPPKICFDIENEARKTLAYIMGGILAIIGIYMAHRRIRALERQVMVGQEQLKVAQNQLQVAQEGQITERFTRAIEQLGSDKMEIRLGGIYALERIANDSDKDYWPIIETLTAYVRERAPWREPPLETPEAAAGQEPAAPDATTTQEPSAPKPATDIQAVLTVLSRRKYNYGQGEVMRLDLSGTDLRGASLWKTHLEGAYLIGTHLENANLVESNLQEAHLTGAYLRGAHLVRAILNEAYLGNAYLEGAHLAGSHLGMAHLQGAHLEGASIWGARMKSINLWEAHLEGACLRDAYLERAFLGETHLNRANLEGAHLKQAHLRKAHLEGAYLSRAHLEGAFLEGATGLTREQLAEAIMDENTSLPDYLKEERPEEKGPEGNDEE
jgi:uncharacterized protein YjbI with pentapeptide repeats